MAAPIILFADNNPDFLRTRGEFLQDEGYELIFIASPTEARRVMEKYRVDLAILDLRLTDDDDEKDESGLTLAKKVAQRVPKIILTGRSFSWETVREILRQQPGSPPIAVDFVTKQEGPEVLLYAVRRALRDRLPPPPPGTEYDLGEIHALLVAAFSVEELWQFCLHRELFRSVLDQVGRDSSAGHLAEALIEYCRHRLYFPELLAEIEEKRPRQYSRYRDRLQRLA